MERNLLGADAPDLTLGRGEEGKRRFTMRVDSDDGPEAGVIDASVTVNRSGKAARMTLEAEIKSSEGPTQRVEVDMPPMPPLRAAALFEDAPNLLREELGRYGFDAEWEGHAADEPSMRWVSDEDTKTSEAFAGFIDKAREKALDEMQVRPSDSFALERDLMLASMGKNAPALERERNQDLQDAVVERFQNARGAFAHQSTGGPRRLFAERPDSTVLAAQAMEAVHGAEARDLVAESLRAASAMEPDDRQRLLREVDAGKGSEIAREMPGGVPQGPGAAVAVAAVMGARELRADFEADAAPAPKAKADWREVEDMSKDDWEAARKEFEAAEKKGLTGGMDLEAFVDASRDARAQEIRDAARVGPDPEPEAPEPEPGDDVKLK